MPYVNRYIPTEEISLFEKIKKVVTELPDLDLGTNDKGESVVLSCHILGRALAKVFNIQYRDGYFYPNYCHTWLLTPTKHIIDPYPVAIIDGPILIDGQAFSPSRLIYIAKSAKSISRGSFSSLWFRRAVRKTIQEINKIIII